MPTEITLSYCDTLRFEHQSPQQWSSGKYEYTACWNGNIVLYLNIIIIIISIWGPVCQEDELLYTCNVVSKPHRCQGDDNKIGRLQKSPLLHLLEDEDGHGDKEQAAQQDGQDGGDHPHNRRTNSPFLSAE